MSYDLVVISGKMGSGKSTLADYLVKNRILGDYPACETLKFADPLYLFHEYILNKMETMTGVPRVKKDGRLLQLLGTEWGRNVVGPNVWVNILVKSLEKFNESKSHWLLLVDDCRFENEFDAIADKALMVRLECPEEVRKGRADAWRNDTGHASEVGLDEYSYEKQFDLYFQTGSQPVDFIGQSIFKKMKEINAI